jgi:hypothetical protein
MKRLLAALAIALCLASPMFAKGHRGGSHRSSSSKSHTSGHTNPHKVHVRGYHRKNGTYVAPHNRTAPNKTKTDNWSTRGNTNPETGKKGTKPPNR